MSFHLSTRGFPMLQTFANAGRGYYMTFTEAHGVDQRPFRSALKREYIAYVPGRGFRMTQKGWDAWEEFTTTSIARGQNTFNKPLTSFFDPVAYGLKEPVKAKVLEMKARGAA